MARILIIAPSWVGDMVMAQALFKQLKEDDPSCEIHLVAPAWVLPLIGRMAEITRGWDLDVGHGTFGWTKRRDLARTLKHQNFDTAIVLPNSFKSALIPYLAGIPRRRGYRGEMRYGLINEMHLLNKSVLPRTVERFVALANIRAPSVAPEILPPRMECNSETARITAQGMNLALERPIVALCPGAEYGPAKQWPLHHFSDLASRLADDGKSVWIFGSAKDYEAGETIKTRAAANQVHNLCGQTDLLQAIDLMSLCRQIVSNDSGLMHVAAALDIPLIALFGSSSPDMTPPLSDKARIVSRELECRPCFKRQCPLAANDGFMECLNNISVDQVYSLIEPVGSS